MLGFIAIFAVLLSVLRTFGLPPIAMAILAGWVLVIAVAQALLFGGRHPRWASACAGVAFVWVGSLVGLLSQWPNIEGRFLPDFLLALLCNAPFAALFGYLTGVGLAGVFLVAHRIRTGRWYETRTREGPQPPVKPAENAGASPFA